MEGPWRETQNRQLTWANEIQLNRVRKTGYLTSLCKGVSGKKLRRYMQVHKNREKIVKIRVLDEKKRNMSFTRLTMCMGEISRTKQEHKLEETRTQTGSGIVAHIQQISQHKP